MFLFTTPLDCDLGIDHLPACRAEAHRSIRTPVVHVSAGGSCVSQLLSLHSGLWFLGATVKSVNSFPASRLSMPPGRSPNPGGVDESLDLPECLCALAQLGRHSGSALRLIVSEQSSRRKSSLDRRRTVPRPGFAGGASEPAWAKGPGVSSPICTLAVLKLCLCRALQLSGAPSLGGNQGALHRIRRDDVEKRRVRVRRLRNESQHLIWPEQRSGPMASSRVVTPRAVGGMRWLRVGRVR